MINLSMPSIEQALKPRITVFGVGGAGGNAINNMIRSNLEGVEFVVGNTDAQALEGSLARKKIQLGLVATRGLGAGSRPDVGRVAAEEQIDEIANHLEGANMVFITAGMGGGTGTGAAPVIARVARERGLLTVGVVTKPFHFEGQHRMRMADGGIAELQKYVDTLIVIPNQNLFRIANERTTFADAFKMADDVLHSGVRGVTDLMVMPGLINLDFADIRSVMSEMGKAMMGTGEATGDRRAVEAAEAAISNPLLDDVSMKGARGVLINITGGYDMTLFEVDEAANRIRDEVDPEANIIFGSTFDQEMDGRMRVSVVATGIDAPETAIMHPQTRTPALALVSDRTRPEAAVPVAAALAPQAAPQTLPYAGPQAGRPVDYHANLVAAPRAPAGPGPGMGDQGAEMAMARAEAPMTAPTAPGGHVGHAAQVAQAAQVVQAAAAFAAAPPPVLASAGPSAQGPLRGESRDGRFVAPRPADPGPRVAVDDQVRRRGASLFERMTGFGSSARRREAAEAALPAPVAPPPVHMEPRPRPVALIHPRAAQNAPHNGAGQGYHRAQPAVEREEDVFDIPAFLRRQAN